MICHRIAVEIAVAVEFAVAVEVAVAVAAATSGMATAFLDDTIGPQLRSPRKGAVMKVGVIGTGRVGSACPFPLVLSGVAPRGVLVDPPPPPPQAAASPRPHPRPP